MRAILFRTPSTATALAAFALCVLAACTPEQRYEPIPAGSTVLAFGDSITFGTGAAPGEDFPRHLADRSGWRVINAGVPGDMARDAGARLGALLEEHQPDVVLVELGGNDFLRQRPESTVKEDLRAIVRTVEGSGALPVLVAVPRFSVLRAQIGALTDSDIYAELAEEELIPLIPGVLSDVLSDEALRADPIHPNSQGYQVVASGIASRLSIIGLLK